MLYNYIIGTYILILREKTYFKILGSVNKGLLRSALIPTITKEKQSFGTYNKNMNNNNNAGRYIYKIDRLR